MSHDGSFVGAFNLSTQAGVAAVLAAIRASQLSSSDKNELRDLVFSYTNGGGDASVRIALEQKLTAHQIAPVVPQRGGAAAPVLPFGTYRPTPNFKAPSVGSSTAAPMPAVSQPAQVAPAAPVAAPVAPVVVPVVSPVTEPAAPPVASTVTPPPVAPQPAPIVATPAQPQSQPPVAAPVTGVPSEAVYLERIRQIKTAVNSKVGNPVNLVDINNAVGREYMNALLEAMKKLGSGAVSEMEPAMQRLEAAFVAVQAAIKEYETTKTAAAPSSSISVSREESVPVIAPETPIQAPVQYVASTPEQAFAVASDHVAAKMPAEAVLPKAEPTQVSDIIVPQPRENTIRERVPMVDVPLPPRPMAPPPVPATEVGPSGFEAQTPSAAPASTVSVPPSLAREPRLRTPNDLPDPASVETGERGDPLYTKEVDDGLEQLLADWSLFKKSGLFGTGPKGREHPLFKKISGLQVPLLLAGRFDGANQEIRQSITDYMNGWRYEQGIIYQPGETFERYLRRVIRHILDLQKKRRGS